MHAHDHDKFKFQIDIDIYRNINHCEYNGPGRESNIMAMGIYIYIYAAGRADKHINICIRILFKNNCSLELLNYNTHMHSNSWSQSCAPPEQMASAAKGNTTRLGHGAGPSPRANFFHKKGAGARNLTWPIMFCARYLGDDVDIDMLRPNPTTFSDMARHTKGRAPKLTDTWETPPHA